jgi:hypothetical protein
MLVAGILLALAAPAAAGAQALPPGNSGVDQYQESIPGAGGNRPTGPSPGASNVSGAGNSSGGAVSGNSSAGAVSGGGSRIAASTAKQLDKLGPDGKATAAIAGATAPAPTKDSSGSSSSSSDTGPGMGWALPVILVLALVAAVSVGLLRRRRGAPPGAA